jgi:hypothetical protein
MRVCRRTQALKDEAVSYRTSVVHKLKEDVVSLEQLNETLRLLDELRDKEGKIDQLYRPIEEMYSLLRLSIIIESIEMLERVLII